MTAPIVTPIVCAEWLAAHLGEQGLVVLDASIERTVGPDGQTIYRTGHDRFEAEGHLRGALHADVFADFSDPAGQFPFTRPSADQLSAVAQRLGLHADSRVIVYDRLNGAWAARIWFVLRAYGLADVHVLDGGLSAWTASGGAMEFGAVQPPLDGSFVASMNNQLFLDTPGVKAMVDGADAALIVCATPRAEFTGEGSSDRRRGHIPGSFNLPYAEILDASGHMDLQRLSGDIGRLGAGPDERLALYCGGGVNAAGLALGLMALGHSKLAIYDGSLNEWRADLALPLETGAVALPDPSRTEATR